MTKKRLMPGLLAGGLMVGMLPGVVSAEPPGADGPVFNATISCHFVGEGTEGNVTAQASGLAGLAQSAAHKALKSFLEAQGWRCVGGLDLTVTRVS